MPEEKADKPIETITLRDAVDRYGDPTALVQLAQLGEQMSEENVDRVLSGRPASHWETRAVRKLGFDVDAIRAALIEPILALLVSGKLTCKGYDAAQSRSRARIPVPSARIADFAFDFASSEASCGEFRLIHVVVERAKGKLRPARAAITKVREWYLGRYKCLIESGEPSNFKKDMEVARAEFGDSVTETMIQDVRRDTISDARKKPGPKPK